MRRTIPLVTLLAAVSLAPPVAADAGRGCEGPLTGPATCTFDLAPGDRGFQIYLQVPPGGPATAARALCCRLLDPATGEPVRHPVSGEYLYYAEARCGVGPGTCSSTAAAPPDALPTDRTVTCEVVGLGGETVLTGSWKCVPV